MTTITVHEGRQKDALKTFETEQWPIADKNHFGRDMSDFSRATFTLIAQEKSHIVGFISIIMDMGVADIDSLLVHTDFQRQGIGAALLQKAEEEAVERGCHLLKLETGKEWDAMHFYEQQGFSTVANLTNYYDHKDFVLMEKRI